MKNTIASLAKTIERTTDNSIIALRLFIARRKFYRQLIGGTWYFIEMPDGVARWIHESDHPYPELFGKLITKERY